jgi:hypothetical protein
MIILALLLAFTAGIIIGKSGKFHFYINGELYTEVASDKFALYVPELHGFGVDIYGVDYTEGVLSPVYRPALKWLYNDRVAGVIISTGDFHEVLIMIAPEFPFLKIKHVRDTSIARSINE